ncbi:MAG: RluA family pseudouridine synthase [Deltaproteobacteria bacterium]|nr:RluA family pseudouridine synthase [Deltaproteobacteria bacterium]
MELRTEDVDVGERLDKVVARHTTLGRARVAELFAAGAVRAVDANGRRRKARKGDRVEAGDVIHLDVDATALDRGAQPDAALDLTIALERPDLVMVDKAAGIPSAPIVAGELGTVANGLLARYPEMADIGFSPREPGLCHRLDTDTSGLLVAARTQAAFDSLVAGMKSGALDKRYLLVCELAAGAVLDERGAIELPLAGHATDATRVVACRDAVETERLRARPAETRYRVLRRRGARALVEATVSRAFRHQIRSHFAAIGAPLVGDAIYGEASSLGRHALHASVLVWPGDDHVAAFEVASPLPPALERLIDE